MTNKSELRRVAKQARLGLAPEERQSKSTAIMNRLWQVIDWSKVTALHCYEPIERLGEVAITDFIIALKVEYPAIKLFTSRQLDNSWQVVSSPGDKPAADIPFNVIIVPMLGFDEQLRRLGYGGGYYDRFLVTQTQARKIGVCFEIGKVTELPVEVHDIKLDIIISEQRVYTPTSE